MYAGCVYTKPFCGTPLALVSALLWWMHHMSRPTACSVASQWSVVYLYRSHVDLMDLILIVVQTTGEYSLYNHKQSLTCPLLCIRGTIHITNVPLAVHTQHHTYHKCSSGCPHVAPYPSQSLPWLNTFVWTYLARHKYVKHTTSQGSIWCLKGVGEKLLEDGTFSWESF